MVGADRPEDARCPCTTKFAELTDDALVWGCDGCLEPLPIPYTVLGRGKEAIQEYLSGLPPRRKLFGAERRRRTQK
jgi:hypothetical protein